MSGPKLDLTPSTIPRLNLRQQLVLGLSVKRAIATHGELVARVRYYIEMGRTEEVEGEMRKIEEENKHIVLGLTAIILSRLRNNEPLNLTNT